MKGVNYYPLGSEEARAIKQDERFIRLWGIATLVPAAILSVLLLLTTLKTRPCAHDCSTLSARFDCYPDGVATEGLCQARGCCWDDSSSPACFYGPGFGYEVNGDILNTSYGCAARVTWKAGQVAPFDGVIDTLRVDVYYETSYRLRVKVSRSVWRASWDAWCVLTLRYRTPIQIVMRYPGHRGPWSTRPRTHCTRSASGQRHSTSL